MNNKRGKPLLAVPVVALLLFIGLSMAFAIVFLGQYPREAWVYTYFMGRTGLLLRLGGFALLLATCPLLVRYIRRDFAARVKAAALAPEQVGEETAKSTSKSSGWLVPVLLMQVVLLLAMSGGPMLRTAQDLWSGPVTGEYEAEIHFVSSHSRVPWHGYRLYLYDEMGQRVSRMHLSKYVSLRDNDGETVFELPVMAPPNPDEEFDRLRLTMTWYPRSATCVEISALERIAEESSGWR